MNISLTSEEKSKQYQFHVILREIASLRGDLKRAESAQRPEQSYIDSIRADLELRFAELKTLPSVVCVVRIDLRDDAGLLVETTNWHSGGLDPIADAVIRACNNNKHWLESCSRYGWRMETRIVDTYQCWEHTK